MPLVGGKMVQLLGNSRAVPPKTENMITTGPSNSTSKYTPRGTESRV